MRLLMSWTRSAITLFVALMLFFPVPPALAGYLNTIDPSRLPKEAIPILSQLGELEPYVEQWQQAWTFTRPKDQMKDTIKELYSISSKLVEKNPDNGELLLLLGIMGFYGHNIDLGGYSQHADMYFSSARKLLTTDYRPLWLLGMHLSKSTRCLEGMRILLEAESKYSIREPMFWEDYAAAAYFASMPKHVLMALDKVGEISGKKSKLEDSLGNTVRASTKTPKPGDRIEAGDLWQSILGDGSVTIMSYPFGYKFAIPRNREGDLQLTNFDGRFAALKVRLTPRMGSSGAKYIPTVQVMAFIAPEGEALGSFSKRFLSKTAKWQKYDAALGLGEVSQLGESAQFYKDDGGAKVLMIAFERKTPNISGLLLEEPRDSPKSMEPSKFYRFSNYYERFKGRLFYQIWLETPARFYDQSLEEFKEILKTFVVE